MNAFRAAASSSRAAFAGRRAFSSTPRSPLAKMTIIGRLGAEPELRTASTGREYIRYVLGTSTGPRDRNETSWFRVSCFDDGPRKDYVLNLPKGTLMHLEADAKMDTFETNEGVKTTRLNLVQRNIEILSKPQRPSEEGPMGAASPADSA
ncbi:ssdna binding protein [Diplodia corticola]|uniref:Ssdna binding protein n=1 Tax=Diplodia corticola TaxID=236234 RepID=A0A1J9RLU9_9PEZI|nr:ssdna binding protein [Diplodia corticola]OJD28900.1 ssdna binding protein [Diplodia corticola]